MKKIIIFTFFFLFTNIILFSQQESIIRTFEDQLKAKYTLSTGTFTATSSNKIANARNRIILKNAQLENGDLIIKYQLAEFRKSEKKLHLNIQPSIKLETGETFHTKPKYLEGAFENGYNANSQTLQLKWLNFQNLYRYGEESIMVNLEGHLVGVPPIDCNNPPTFNKQQKWLHYTIAGLSIGSVITGHILEKSGKKKYEQYRNEVFEGIVSDANSTNTYNKANTQNKAGGLLKTIGFATFGLNAAAYIFRQISYNQKRKDYDYYCGEKKWSVKPHINRQAENKYAGMQMAFQF